MPPLAAFAEDLMVFIVFIFAVCIVCAIVGLLLVTGSLIKNERRKK